MNNTHYLLLLYNCCFKGNCGFSYDDDKDESEKRREKNGNQRARSRSKIKTEANKGAETRLFCPYRRVPPLGQFKNMLWEKESHKHCCYWTMFYFYSALKDSHVEEFNVTILFKIPCVFVFKEQTLLMGLHANT